jgi:hypothetical protein
MRPSGSGKGKKMRSNFALRVKVCYNLAKIGRSLIFTDPS